MGDKVRTRVRTHARVHTRMHTHTYKRTNAHTRAHTRAHTHTNTHTYTHDCMQDAMLAEAIQAGMEIDGRRRSEAPASNVGPSPPFPPPALGRLDDFFQTPTHVTANYYIRGATPQNCEVKWTANTLAVVRMLSSRDGWKRSETSG